MDTTTSVVLTGGVVALGRWSQNKPIEFTQFVGVGFVAVFLAAIGSSSPELAQQFGALILIAALLVYTIPIAKAFGYSR